MTQGQRPPGSGLHGLEGACLSPLLHGFHSGIAASLIQSRTVERQRLKPLTEAASGYVTDRLGL